MKVIQDGAMRKCYSCHTPVLRTYQVPSFNNIRVCTACRSQLYNSRQLGRGKLLNRMQLLMLQAKLFAQLATRRGKELLLKAINRG